MSFENVTFPDYPLKHGIQKETIYPIEVRTNGTTEWRGTHVRFERFAWSISSQTMTPEQKDIIRSFLVKRNHGLNSFRFQDPMSPVLVDAPLSYNSGTNWNLYLPFDSSTPGNLHPIYNPIVNELTVTVNGVPGTLGAVSYINSVPVISVVGTTGTEEVKISGNLYYTVKLATPLNYVLAALDCLDQVALYSVQPIQLVEVFGEF